MRTNRTGHRKGWISYIVELYLLCQLLQSFSFIGRQQQILLLLQLLPEVGNFLTVSEKGIIFMSCLVFLESHSIGAQSSAPSVTRLWRGCTAYNIFMYLRSQGLSTTTKPKTLARVHAVCAPCQEPYAVVGRADRFSTLLPHAGVSHTWWV